MGNIITSKLFHSILLFTVIGEFFLPWVLCRYYDGYNSRTMTMSALGSLQSPVRVIYKVLSEINYTKNNQRLMILTIIISIAAIFISILTS